MKPAAVKPAAVKIVAAKPVVAAKAGVKPGAKVKGKPLAFGYVFHNACTIDIP